MFYRHPSLKSIADAEQQQRANYLIAVFRLTLDEAHAAIRLVDSGRMDLVQQVMNGELDVDRALAQINS